MEAVADPLAQGTESTCAAEPIHAPGSIQPHGLLLLFDAVSGSLEQWAGDSDQMLGIAPVVGCKASDLLGVPIDKLIDQRLLVAGNEALSAGRILPRGRAPLAVLAHLTGRFLAIELQAAGGDEGATIALEMVRAISDRINSVASTAKGGGLLDLTGAAIAPN